MSLLRENQRKYTKRSIGVKWKTLKQLPSVPMHVHTNVKKIFSFFIALQWLLYGWHASNCSWTRVSTGDNRMQTLAWSHIISQGNHRRRVLFCKNHTLVVILVQKSLSYSAFFKKHFMSVTFWKDHWQWMLLSKKHLHLVTIWKSLNASDL